MSGRPTSPENAFVFQQVLEGLFIVGLKGKITPLLDERLRAAGLDLSRPFAPAYPREDYNRFVRITAETLWPDEPPERAYHALGRQLLQGYSHTLLGKALAAMLKVIGPRKALDRMTRNFRSGSNYNDTRVTDVGPGEVLFWMNEPELHPSYVAGIVEAALELAGARQLDIQVHEQDAQGCTYRIRWAV
jgi:uncharacterized protein (TIGR02265 family)